MNPETIEALEEVLKEKQHTLNMLSDQAEQYMFRANQIRKEEIPVIEDEINKIKADLVKGQG